MTLNIAHRGYSGAYPENTMPAFEAAIDAGADGVEFDVQFSKDGALVIMHDETVDRTTDGKGFVKDHTLAELKSLDASATFKGKYGIVRVPTLEEYLERVKGLDFLTNIELKTGVFEYDGIESAVTELVRRYGLQDRVIISSFNHYSVLRAKAAAPEIRCGFLTETWILNAGAYTRSHGIECWHPHWASVTKETAAELKENGIAVNVWTVNEADEALRLQSLGVDAVIGNYPEKIGKALRGE